MPIEATIHARLAADTTLDGLVDGRMFPSEPSVNTPVPYLYFTVTSTDSQNFTGGPSSLVRYGFTVDMWAKTAPDLWPVMDRVRYVLHGWRGGNVQLCSETGSNTDQQETGYHAQKTFVVWANLGNVVALADSTGTVATGPDYVSLSACDNTLDVNCDGLTYNGTAVATGGPFLTPTGTISTNQTSSGSVLGNCVAKLPVYNQTGTLVGYVPILQSIT